MNLKKLKALLCVAIAHREPLLIQGAPGLGKSAIVREAALSIGFDCIVVNPALLDPTDIGGIPIMSNGELKRALDDQLNALLTTTRKTVLFLDEIGQASAAMQSACAPIILDRRLGGRPLPECVSVICATNRRSDKAGVNAFASHLISRMAVVTAESDADSWKTWALGAGFGPEIPGFISFRPTLLHPWNGDVAARAALGEPYPCPRSWERVARFLQLPISEFESELIDGCVGGAAGTELRAYLRVSRDLPDVDLLLQSPETIKWSGSPSYLYALASAIAWRTETMPAAVMKAAETAYARGAAEYAVMMIRDAFTRSSKLMSLPEWSKMVASPLGKCIAAV